MMKGDSVRGRKDIPARLVLNFWKDFSWLAMDDPEDPDNEKIRMLRNFSMSFLKEENLN